MVASALARPVLLPARADLCLDYANTLYWRGSEPPTEEFHRLGDVLAWHASREIVPADVVSAMTTWWDERPRQAEAAFASALALREALYRIFSATSGGEMPAAGDLAIL